MVWVQHADDELVAETDGWQIVPELEPAESEPIVHKSFGAHHRGLLRVRAAPADKVIAHTNMYWTWQAGPDRTAEVVAAADVAFDNDAATPSASS